MIEEIEQSVVLSLHLGAGNEQTDGTSVYTVWTALPEPALGS